jgi:hypothetical protein
MKKIALSVLLTILFLTNFSCTDHYIPERPAVVETLPFEWAPARVSEGWNSHLFWNLQFSDLGTHAIEEYGIVYSSLVYGSEEPVSEEPSIDDVYSSTIPFSSTVVVDETITEFHKISGFESLYYRAYAKLAGGRVVYGEILESHLD